MGFFFRVFGINSGIRFFKIILLLVSSEFFLQSFFFRVFGINSGIRFFKIIFWDFDWIVFVFVFVLKEKLFGLYHILGKE